MPPPDKPKAATPQDREAKLAAALRANLRRRKAEKEGKAPPGPTKKKP